jgi:hypothetical protein
VGVEKALQPVRRVLMAEGVVAPDDGRARAAGLRDAAAKRRPVRSLAHDARANAHGLHELADIQKHDMAIAFAEPFKIMPVFLAIAKKQAGTAQPLEIRERVAV